MLSSLRHFIGLVCIYGQMLDVITQRFILACA